MNGFLLASQLFLSLLAGFMAFRAVRRLRNDGNGIRDGSDENHQALPAKWRWMHTALTPFAVPASQLAKPSDRIRRALWCIGADHRLTDVAFSRVCWSVSLFLTTITGLVWVLAWILKIQISSVFMAAMLAFSLLAPLTLPRAKLRDLSAVAQQRIGQAFPSFLDVLALTLESGQNFQSALQLAVQRMPEQGSPSSLRRQLQEVLRGIRAGQSRQYALQQLAARVDLQEVTQFVASMSTAESQGVSVTALLRRQSEQLRTSRALAAERHAMKLPVKLLAPLAICIFPCTFLVIAFPIAIRLSESGLF